jgi:hypothetical protein
MLDIFDARQHLKAIVCGEVWSPRFESFKRGGPSRNALLQQLNYSLARNEKQVRTRTLFFKQFLYIKFYRIASGINEANNRDD